MVVSFVKFFFLLFAGLVVELVGWVILGAQVV